MLADHHHQPTTPSLDLFLRLVILFLSLDLELGKIVLFIFIFSKVILEMALHISLHQGIRSQTSFVSFDLSIKAK
jgi:hypothetical protein